MGRFVLSAILLLALPFAVLSEPAAPTTSSSPPQISVGLWPFLSLPSPLDSNAYLFSAGAGAEISGEYTLPFFPMLFGRAAIDYGFTPVHMSGSGLSVSILGASAGMGFQYPASDWLSLRAMASAGYYYGFENSTGGAHSSGNGFFSAGLGANFAIGPSFVLGTLLSYRVNLSLLQSFDVSLGISYNLFPAASSSRSVPAQKAPVKPQPSQPEPTRPTPLKEATQKPLEEAPRGLVISDMNVGSVFPIFHTYYDDHPVGAFTLRNTEKASATGVVVTLIIREFMDAPKKCLDLRELKAGESRNVDLYALFKTTILGVTEPTKVAAEISVSYTLNGKAASLTDVQTMRIYDRNAMTWDDNRKAAAFVTAKEPVVLIFSNNVNAFVKGKLNRAIDQNLQMGMAIHNALRLYGISYVSNPLTSYAVISKDALAVDTLKFPRQTFEYRSGDCSDLTLLYCALMESLQIETAFLTIPGHIFMAFALKASPEEARGAFGHPDQLIIRDDTVWVPVEVTEREGTFLTAWQEGAKEWRENLSRNQAGFYRVHDAWKTYEPVGLPGAGSSPVLPDAARVVRELQADVSRHIEIEIYSKVAELRAAITRSKESPKAVNALGVLYARYDLCDKAEAEFKRSLEKGEYVPALVNLGNLAFLRTDMEAALSFYERAHRKSPDAPVVLLGIARASQELEDYRTARRSYDELKKVAPKIAQQFAYLELKGEESTRAAEISGTKEMMVWAEE